MIRNMALALAAGSVLVSCQMESPYRAATQPEKTELEHARLKVYPDDVRTNLEQYTNTTVAWPGIIQSTDAWEEDRTGGIHAATVFEHHYFDWQEEETTEGVELLVSPGGEGRFRCQLHLRKASADATAYDAERYAGRGKFAILYGVPESVDPDGTIVLKYRYMRVFGRGQYNTNELEYGRVGQPFHPAGWSAGKTGSDAKMP
jgi:hypothetical protein